MPHLCPSSISVPFRLILRRRSLVYLPSFLIFLSFFSSFPFPSLQRFIRHIETRRTKETVTPQLAKLLIYSLFNQINERVDAHFYAPVQLFMVYGNCPKRTRVHRSRPRPGPFGRSPVRSSASRTTALSSFAGARHSYALYHFPLVLLPTRFSVFPFRVRPVKAALRLSN